MSVKASKTAIGIFVVGGVALIILAVIALGSGKLFTERPTYVMFFEGSVNGLKVGAPVLFRGVPVGTVSEIRMQINPKDLSVLIPVYVEIGDSKIQTLGSETLPHDVNAQKEITSQMIKRGLRSRLEMQSVVTGLLQVSLDFYPDTRARFVGAEPRYLEIPTIPTSLQMLAERVERLPLEKIFDRINLAVNGIQRLVNSPEMQGMAASIQQAANDTRTLIGRIDNQIDPMAQSFNGAAGRFEQLAATLEQEIGPLTSSLRHTSEEAGVMLQKAGTAFAQVQDMTSEDSPTFYRLRKALEELELAARSLRTLSDTMEQNPQMLLFGKQNLERKR